MSIRSTGYAVYESYLTEEECSRLLTSIRDYRRKNPLPEIHRPTKPRPLRYRVIDGDAILNSLPEIWDLYVGRLLKLTSQLFDERLVPLHNQRAGINVNLMAPQRSVYRWHYDRNLATAILYLNRVDGGQTELYPNYRVLLANGRALRVQRVLDRIIHFPPLRSALARKVIVRPDTGRLLVMCGNRSWHSVGPVQGSQERINIIFAYDRTGAEHGMQHSLDADLYSNQEHDFRDPNYGL